MANRTAGMAQAQGNKWRLVGWGLAAALLTLPFFAMQLNAEGVHWTTSDFVIMGAMIATVGGLFELGVRISGNWSYRGGLALALLGGFLVTWVNLAVGIVGSENNPGNQWFFAAVLVGVAGALIARLRAAGMAAAMFATAAALMIAFAIAVGGVSLDMFGAAVITIPFILSGLLFRRAAR